MYKKHAAIALLCLFPAIGYAVTKAVQPARQLTAPVTHSKPAAVPKQAPKKDAGLIRALAETLRGKSEKAEAVRSALAKALIHPEVET